MLQLGLKEGIDFMAIGTNKAGKQCIEGLVPERVLSKVYSENTDLVMQLTAQETKDRKSAKSALKQKILAKFQSEPEIIADDLKGFLSLFKNLSNRMS
jgi:putative ATP-dependent endonuclease of the OLD family